VCVCVCVCVCVQGRACGRGEGGVHLRGFYLPPGKPPLTDQDRCKAFQTDLGQTPK
jgi:hypothetical protein